MHHPFIYSIICILPSDMLELLINATQRATPEKEDANLVWLSAKIPDYRKAFSGGFRVVAAGSSRPRRKLTSVDAWQDIAGNGATLENPGQDQLCLAAEIDAKSAKLTSNWVGLDCAETLPFVCKYF